VNQLLSGLAAGNIRPGHPLASSPDVWQRHRVNELLYWGRDGVTTVTSVCGGSDLLSVRILADAIKMCPLLANGWGALTRTRFFLSTPGKDAAAAARLDEQHFPVKLISRNLQK
jgi:hypothetical protein